MNTLEKKIVWNQSLLFLYVAVILGLPYLWLTLDLSGNQFQPFLVIYAIRSILLLGIWVVLPLQWARPLLVQHGPDH